MLKNKKKIFIALLLLVALFSLSGCDSGSDSIENGTIEDASLEGYVYETESGNLSFQNEEGFHSPVQDANIVVEEEMITTDDEGYFLITGLSQNKEFEVSIVAQSQLQGEKIKQTWQGIVYTNQKKNNIAEYSSSSNWVIDTNNAILNGNLYVSDEGEFKFSNYYNEHSPVVDATIKLGSRTTKTDDQGYFQLLDVDVGQHSISVDGKSTTGERVVWDGSFDFKQGELIHISQLFGQPKDWNVIMFFADKARSSLDDQIQHFYRELSDENNLDNANLFIVHGHYNSSEDTSFNKTYYLSGENNRVQIKDYSNSNINPDFADPQFYSDVINNITANYPSDKMMISLSGHGNGWEPTSQGYPTEMPDLLGYLVQERDPNYMDPEAGSFDAFNSFELREALKNIDQTVNILNLTSCHSGQIAVLTDLPEDRIDYIIASPSYSYTTDYVAHIDILDDINNGVISPRQLGENYIEHYIKHLEPYEDMGSRKSLFDMNYKRQLLNDMVHFSSSLKEDLESSEILIDKYRNEVMESHEYVQTYFNRNSTEAIDSTHNDLVNLAEYIHDNPEYGNANQSVSSLINSLNNFIAYSNYSPGVEGTIDNLSEAQKNSGFYDYARAGGLALMAHPQRTYNTTWFDRTTDWLDVLNIVDENQK